MFFEAAEKVDFILDVDSFADAGDVASFVDAGAVGATAYVLDGAIDGEVYLGFEKIFGDVAAAWAGIYGLIRYELGFTGLGQLGEEVDVILIERAGGEFCLKIGGIFAFEPKILDFLEEDIDFLFSIRS